MSELPVTRQLEAKELDAQPRSAIIRTCERSPTSAGIDMGDGFHPRVKGSVIVQKSGQLQLSRMLVYRHNDVVGPSACLPSNLPRPVPPNLLPHQLSACEPARDFD